MFFLFLDKTHRCGVQPTAAFNRVNTVMQYHCRPDELGTGPICVYQRGGGGLIIDFFCLRWWCVGMGCKAKGESTGWVSLKSVLFYLDCLF